jgi:ABC-type branched-subunit amino acid transport system substrate-binding protein
MRTCRFLAAAILLLAVVVSAFPASAEQGVTDKELLIGMSTALSGPSAFLGMNFRTGVDAYLAVVNASGGVHGRKIKLIAYDDRYEPANAVVNVNRMIAEDKVFCLLGNVGTPTALAIKPILDGQKVILFAPFTGAESLRKPVDRYLFHYRASYNQEIESFIQGMVDVLGYRKIAVFYQDDGYGKAVLEGARLALEKRGLKPAATGVYTRNYEDVIPAMNDIMSEKPQAVVMAGTYSACSKFIRSWKRKAILGGGQKSLDPVFMNVSFVGPGRFATLLENYGNGVVVTQVVPPFSQGGANFPAVSEYLAILDKYQPNTAPSFGSLEGYLATKVFVEILKRAGKNLTRESFSQTAESLRDLDIQAGNRISFSPENHQGSQIIYPTVIRNGAFVPVTDWHVVKTQ